MVYLAVQSKTGMFFSTVAGQMLPLLLTVCFPLLFLMTGKELVPFPGGKGDGYTIVDRMEMVTPCDRADTVDTASVQGVPLVEPLPGAPPCMVVSYPLPDARGCTAPPFHLLPGNKAPPHCR